MDVWRCDEHDVLRGEYEHDGPVTAAIRRMHPAVDAVIPAVPPLALLILSYLLSMFPVSFLLPLPLSLPLPLPLPLPLSPTH